MKRKLLPLLAASQIGFATCAHADGFFLALGVGAGDVSVDGSVFSSGQSFSFDGDSEVIVGELLAGYEFANDLFVEIAVQGYDTLSFLGLGDILDLDTIRAGVGGYLPSDSRLRLFGKAGLTFWDLTARESFVFNPGPEERTKRDGTDLFVEAGAEFRFTESFRLGLSVEYANLEFGSSNAVKLTLKFLP